MDKKIINIYLDDSDPHVLKIKCNNTRVMRRITHFISYSLSAPDFHELLQKDFHD